jgi:hypothetical protein
MPVFASRNEYNSPQSSPPSNDFVEEAFALAKKYGIDPADPHPDDYKEDNEKCISFKEGSKFVIWVNGTVCCNARPVRSDMPGNSLQYYAVWPLAIGWSGDYDQSTVELLSCKHARLFTREPDPIPHVL